MLLLAIVLAGSLKRQALAAACPADHSSERVHLAYVYDGDTRGSRHHTWLDLEDSLTVQIPVQDLANFNTLDFDSLTGQSIEVRGWVRPDRNKLKLKVRYPSALTIMTTSQQP